jgi:plasmid maintenance system antidote protein VapI
MQMRVNRELIMKKNLSIVSEESSPDVRKPKSNKHIQYNKLLDLCSKVPDKFRSPVGNRIPFGIGINTNSDSEFYTEFMRHLSVSPQHDIERMHEESCLEIVNSLIVSQLDIERRQENDLIKSIVTSSKMISPCTIDNESSYKGLSSEFFLQFQSDSNNRHYMKQVQTSMANIATKDPSTDGAKTST